MVSFDCSISRYVDRQNLLKLEAEEIGDKEAEESPVESEEEENNDDVTSLLNKEKRKERLKRLIQEKSNKSSAIKGKSVAETKTKESEEQTLNKEKDEDLAKKTTSDNKENKLNNEVISSEPKDENIMQSNQDKIHSLSDESDRIYSDIDELHLLEKLHSEKEAQTSTLESSDSETPISISDTLSSGDNKKQASDVISIENSSYSESEIGTITEEKIENVEKRLIEIDNNSSRLIESEKSIQKTNNNEYNDSVENILLALSDEEQVEKDKGTEDDKCTNVEKESTSSKEPVHPNNETSVKDCNLQEQSISIHQEVNKTITLEKDSICIESKILEGEKSVMSNSDKITISIDHTVTANEQALLEESTDLKNRLDDTDLKTKTKQLSTELSLDLEKDSICIEDKAMEEPQMVKDAVNIDKEFISDKEEAENNEQIINKDSLNFDNDLTDAQKSQTTTEQDVNGDTDMIDVSNKELFCSVDDTRKEEANCIDKPSITTIGVANNFNTPMKTDLIDNSIVTEKEDGLLSNVVLDELRSNTSPNIIV